MKRLIYILTACCSLCWLNGCVEEVVEFDSTYTARVISNDVDHVLNSTAYMTVRTLVLSLYMDAATEEDRNQIDDQYFTYIKVRNDGESVWRVHGKDYTERYYVADGKSLTQEGALWLVNEFSPAYGSTTFDSSEIIINRTEHGKYRIKFNRAEMGIEHIYTSYNDYCRYGSYYYSDNSGSYLISGDVNIETDFFDSSGQTNTKATVKVTGGVVLTDSENANYSLDVNITEPLTLLFTLPALSSETKCGRLTVNVDELVSKTHEKIDVNYPDGSDMVHIVYTTADGAFEGLYLR